MGPWNTSGENTMVTKAEAADKIKKLAEDKGLKGTFKVFYDGEIVADPNDLPDSVDMKLVEVSAVLDQA